MIATLVFVDVKPEFVEEFKQITVYNHENTRKEAGNIRFDVLQDNNDPTQFVLVEVFADTEAAAFHKTTAHYLKWRDAVAPYMASPRRAMPTSPVAFS